MVDGGGGLLVCDGTTVLSFFYYFSSCILLPFDIEFSPFIFMQLTRCKVLFGQMGVPHSGNKYIHTYIHTYAFS